MDYLKKKNINVIELHMWHPNSPDINPLDYAIWGALQQRVYHQRQFKTVEELKRATVTEWQKLSQRFTGNSRPPVNGVYVLNLVIKDWRRTHRPLQLATIAHHFNTTER